jgi:hypothetical protein
LRGARAPDPRVVRAKRRLDRLALYPRPVRIERVRLFVAPWFFRLPHFRRFDGHAFYGTILLRSADATEDLVTHELCHVWQLQHRPLRMPLTYLFGYWANPYERQARAAVAATIATGAPAGAAGPGAAGGPGPQGPGFGVP